MNDILFDDAQWVVRYLTVKTGGLLTGKTVLITPSVIGSLEWDKDLLNVNLTREKIEKSPALSTDEPVSRQFEADYHDYYSWPYYWSGIPYGGLSLYAGMGTPGFIVPFGNPPSNQDLSYRDAVGDLQPDPGDAHLRSSQEVDGYEIAARDGHIGHVEDFMFDDETWKICYLAVDTQNWWPGKKVLVPLDCINSVNWSDRTVSLAVTRDQIRNGPEWVPHETIGRDFEHELATYFTKTPVATVVGAA